MSKSIIVICIIIFLIGIVSCTLIGYYAGKRTTSEIDQLILELESEIKRKGKIINDLESAIAEGKETRRRLSEENTRIKQENQTISDESARIKQENSLFRAAMEKLRSEKTKIHKQLEEGNRKDRADLEEFKNILREWEKERPDN